MRGSSAFISASLWLSFMPSFSAPVNCVGVHVAQHVDATRFGPGAPIDVGSRAFFSGRYRPIA